MLVEKLDDLWNGEMSVRRQKERIEKNKKIKMEAKNRKNREKKKLAKALAELAVKEGTLSSEEHARGQSAQRGDYEEYGHNPWERKPHKSPS